MQAADEAQQPATQPLGRPSAPTGSVHQSSREREQRRERAKSRQSLCDRLGLCNATHRATSRSPSRKCCLHHLFTSTCTPHTRCDKNSLTVTKELPSSVLEHPLGNRIPGTVLADTALVRPRPSTRPVPGVADGRPLKRNRPRRPRGKRFSASWEMRVLTATGY